jgi:hypothetical protein
MLLHSIHEVVLDFLIDFYNPPAPSGSVLNEDGVIVVSASTPATVRHPRRGKTPQ